MTAKQDSYEQIKTELSYLQELVYQSLEKPRTIDGVQHHLKTAVEVRKGYSTITGRLSELESLGLIHKTKERVNGQTLWMRTPLERIEARRKEIAQERYRNWLIQARLHSEFLTEKMREALILALK